jgi:hypothetical protein
MRTRTIAQERPEDLCASGLPFHQLTMPQDQVDRVHAGLKLFEGTVYWGRDWGPGRYDEMHFQVGYNMYGNSAFADFANRLRTVISARHGNVPRAFQHPFRSASSGVLARANTTTRCGLSERLSCP